MSFWIWGYTMSVFFTIMAARRTDQFVREGKKQYAGSIVLYGLLSIGFMLIGTADLIGDIIINNS